MRAMVSDCRSFVLAVCAAAETHISMVKRTKLRIWNSCCRGLLGLLSVVPSGTSHLCPTFPARKRWAKIVRPSGARRYSCAVLCKRSFSAPRRLSDAGCLTSAREVLMRAETTEKLSPGPQRLTAANKSKACYGSAEKRCATQNQRQQPVKVRTLPDFLSGERSSNGEAPIPPI